jgi:uncharacterized membrane protein
MQRQGEFKDRVPAVEIQAVSSIPRATRHFGLHHLFVLFAIGFGVPLALLTAPFQAADEPNHFLRAYQISEGGIVPLHQGGIGGGNVPVSLFKAVLLFQRVRSHDWETTNLAEIQSAWQVPLEPEKREFKSFVNTAIYSPTGYLPQAGAIAIGRAAGLGPVGLMYAARLGNLLAWTILGYFTMRLAPQLGRPMLVLLLMPMSLFQAASVSGDAMTNALAALFTASVWRLAAPRASREGDPAQLDPVSRWQFAGLLVLMTALSLSKFAYWPLVFLVLLIPAGRFGGAGRRAIAVAILACAGLAAVAAWSPHTQGLDAVIYDRPDINARQQVAYLQSHPGRIGPIAWQTIQTDGPFLLRSFVGRLGSVDIRLPMGFIAPYLIVMLIFCAAAPSIVNRPRIVRTLVVIVSMIGVSVTAIAALNYIFWTPVGERHVKGMQGRHLIPLAPAVIILLVVLFQPLTRYRLASLTEKRLDWAAAIVALVSCGVSLLAVYLRYYN